MSFFKPEDFDDDNGGYGPYAERITSIANRLLKERGMQIFTNIGNYEIANGNNVWTAGHGEPTHQALLVCIEKLTKEPQVCEHEPITELNSMMNSSRITPGKVGFSFFNKESWSCMKCGIKLKAKWEPDVG